MLSIRTLLALATALSACNSRQDNQADQSARRNVTPPPWAAPAVLPGVAVAPKLPPSFTASQIVIPDMPKASPPPSLASAPFYGSDARFREPFDERAARDHAESELDLETYSSIGRPYGCTVDCSGHEAGFKYRARHGYGMPLTSDYDARSFRQGQQAYDDEVDRRVEEAREEYEQETLNEPY